LETEYEPMTLYYLFLFLVPFQHHPILGMQLAHIGPIPLTPIKLVGAPLVAAAMVLARPHDAAPRPPSGMLLMFLAFAGFPVLGSLLSYVPFPTDDISTMIAFAILMVATNLLINTEDRLRNTILVTMLVETFASTWLYRQYYIYHWPRPIGPSADPNYEALSLVMVLPFAIWLSQYEKRRLWKWSARMCVPVLAFAVFVAQSRGGLLAIGVMAGLAWLNSRRKLRLTVLFLVGASVLSALGPSKMIQRVEQIQVGGQWQTGAELSTRARVELGRAGLRMMEAHPIFGVGLEQFREHEFHYNPVLMVIEPRPHIAHDTYVQIGAEGGVPTLALYLAIMALALFTYRALETSPEVPEALAALATAMRIGLIGFLVAAVFLSAEYVKEPWIVLALTPNLYAIAHQAAVAKAKPATAPAAAARRLLVTPGLPRAG
jgi:O-antigen ligase